jgi:predicted nucleic acid-binding protein
MMARLGSPLIIDASVVVPIVRPEALSASARRFFGRSRPSELIVPAHFWIEVANFIVRHFPTVDAAAEALHALDTLRLRTVPVDRPLLLLAIQHAHASRLTVYDALYLALAEVEDARLATADRALAEAAGARAILLSDEGETLHETPAEYGRAAPAADPDAWPGLDAYADRLRRERSAATR